MTLAGAVSEKQIIVVCGSGGVGKTSVSAALALNAARTRRAIVLTIDPARRLASALGLSGGLGHEPTKVEIEGLRLDAAMLDMKTAWDELVARYSPTAEVEQNIRGNRLYGGLSEHFVGSQGYMAMERLAEIHDRGDYDVVIVDTPPTRNALDFLDAPKRMTDFLGGSLLRWLAKPYASAGKIGLRAFNLTASPFLRIADRVLGSQVLEDLSDFVMNFQSLYDGFKKRAGYVLDLMCSQQTGFVVVTTMEAPPLAEAGYFVDRLTTEGLPLSAIVANKVVPATFASPEARAALESMPEGSDEPHATARRSLEVLSRLAERDMEALRSLQHRARVPVTTVPLLSEDVHDLESLARLAAYLSDGSAGAAGSAMSPAEVSGRG